MKKIIFSFSCILTVAWAQGQTIERAVISSAGAHVEQGLIMLSYTTAQTATETVSSTGNLLTQGFQQPEDMFTPVNEIKTDDYAITVYPNPAFNEIHINIKSNISGSYRVTVFNLLGAVVRGEYNFDSNTDNTIGLQGLESGTYMVRVTNSDQSRVLRVLKIKE